MGHDTRDYFLKIEGIEGEAKDEIHGKEIRISDFSFSMTNRGNRGHYGVGRPVFENVRFLALVDQSYPKLQEALARNLKLAKAVLTCRKAGKLQQDFLKLTFSDVYIATCKIAGESSIPMVAFTMDFAKTEIEYREQLPNGTLGGSIMTVYMLTSARSDS